MAPDIGVRISTMLRALEEVILPAIDPAQKPAIQQARLCILNLKMIAEQHDKAYHLALTELRMAAKLLARIRDSAGDVLEPDLQARLDAAASNELNAVFAPTTDVVEASSRAYRELVDAILESRQLKADRPAQRSVIDAVMAHGAEEALLRRAWSANSGLEADPGALPSIESLVADATRKPRLDL